ncbi:unnamed protein product [Effrenium voratum]|nr:unnamed protein product [Effrenium voratum]|mmetsp:Transcript_69450/g.165537  ORF Transcript_69450/g.165537 Transcript_69450/m.165537 type:complete len:258 (-) Transcript_69450:116-889(-)
MEIQDFKMQDSWAALHLPAIEELLIFPEEDPAIRLARGVEPGPYFRSVLSAAPMSQDLERSFFEAPTPRETPGVPPGFLGFAQDDPEPNPSPNSKSAKGSTEGRGSGPISHKKVPRKVNIQEEFAEEGVEITTAMIRNVPNQLNRKQFVERLDQLGFQGLYDFVYVPMDRATRMNVGYAFVNFVRPEIFRLCQSSLQGKKFLDKEDGDKRRSGKPIIVSAAHVQGLERNERHFKDAAVAHTLHRPVKYAAKDELCPR